MKRKARRSAVPAPQLQPVILGGDIGSYSLARTFHEAYGVRSIVVSSVSTGIVRHSRILHSIVEPNLHDPQGMLAALEAIAAKHQGAQLLLLGSADWLVRMIVESRDEIPSAYTVPYVDLPTLDRLTDKQQFGELCAELDIPFPQTIVCDLSSPESPDFSSLQFPVIAKTADSAAYHRVEFPGKLKVFSIDTPAELEELLAKLRTAGFDGTFLVQDKIPGDDSGMRILTCYVKEDGQTVFSAGGQVLLEEHAPGALGNPVSIITGHDEVIADQAARLLSHVGWKGYANFDLKYDPRNGKTVFFELNPRLGRSNFYITAGGVNHVELYVRDQLQGLDPLPPDTPAHLVNEQLYSVIPTGLVKRYAIDPALRRKLGELSRSRRVTNPLWYRAEVDPRRIWYVLMAQVNHFRKFRKYYPLSQHRAAAHTPGVHSA